MQNINISKLLNHEDALKYIVQYLSFKDTQGFSTYGYDLYLPNAMRKWCQEHASQLGVQAHETEKFVYDISPYFYEAAWELCRRGILRPGVQSFGKQSIDDGSAGNGYSITPFGKQWLSESDKDIFIPTEPGRFSEMLAPFSKIFGSGFHERANEAIRCYNGHTYLACCVMCGAAAELILLHLAIQKDGVEEKVLKLYKASNGRKKLEDLIVGQQKQNLKIDFEVVLGY